MGEDRGELAALQARAYGPSADILADPAALRRLEALEEAGRRARTAPPAPPAPPIVDAVPGVPAPPGRGPAAASTTPEPAPAPDGVEALESAVTDAPDEPPPPRRWSTPQVLLAVAAAVVVTAAVTVPVSLLAAPRGPQPVAVLHEDPEAEVAAIFEDGSSTDAVRYDDFYGIEISGGTSAEVGGRCLMVLFGAESSGGAGSAGTGSCAAAGLDPWLDLPVDEQLDEEIRARYGTGATLRFTLTGDEVLVFVSRSATA